MIAASATGRPDIREETTGNPAPRRIGWTLAALLLLDCSGGPDPAVAWVMDSGRPEPALSAIQDGAARLGEIQRRRLGLLSGPTYVPLGSDMLCGRYIELDLEAEQFVVSLANRPDCWFDCGEAVGAEPKIFRFSAAEQAWIPNGKRLPGPLMTIVILPDGSFIETTDAGERYARTFKFVKYVRPDSTRGLRVE